MTKVCRNCKKEKPLSQFDTYNTKKGEKHISICKSCESKLSGCEFSQYDEITDNTIITMYEDVLKGKRKVFNSFITLARPDTYLVIANYLFRDILNCNTKEKVCESFNGNTLKKYKYNFHMNQRKTIMELIKETFPEYNIKPWELKYGNIHGMYDTDKNKKDCIEWFLNNLIKDKIIINQIDIIERDDIYKLIQRYKMSGIIKKFEKSSVYMLMWYFNNFTDNIINEWDFFVPPRNFWTDKENCIRAYKYMLEKEGLSFKWDDYKQRDFIINNINKETFRKNNIYGCYIYFGNIYEATKQSLNKELFYQWELKYTPSNFWQDKKNRDEALIQLIEKLELSNEDIPNYLYQGSLRETEYNKFNTICTNYYKGNYYYWLEEIYPNKFKIEDFNVAESKEGIVFTSKDELRIYEYIKYQLNKNIKYIGNKKYKQYFYSNEKENENYQPDFIIKDYKKDAIVEYFGLYNPNSKSDIIKKYTDKAKRKIKYFNNRNDIFFIPIFPIDIKDGFKELKEKIKEFKADGCQLF